MQISGAVFQGKGTASKCKGSKIKHIWCFQGVTESHSGWSIVSKAERVAEEEVREGASGKIMLGICRTLEFVMCSF